MRGSRDAGNGLKTVEWGAKAVTGVPAAAARKYPTDPASSTA